MSKKDELIELSDNLLSELRGMIASTRKQVAQVTNTALVMLYWQIGRRIHHEILDEKRAEYGRQIVASLGRQLALIHYSALIPTKNEQQPGEKPPLGLILCAGKKEEQIELLELGKSGIHVAEYLTALPSRELLQQKLHTAIEISRTRLESREGDRS